MKECHITQIRFKRLGMNYALGTQEGSGIRVQIVQQSARAWSKQSYAASHMGVKRFDIASSFEYIVVNAISVSSTGRRQITWPNAGATCMEAHYVAQYLSGFVLVQV